MERWNLSRRKEASLLGNRFLQHCGRKAEHNRETAEARLPSIFQFSCFHPQRVVCNRFQQVPKELWRKEFWPFLSHQTDLQPLPLFDIYYPGVCIWSR